MTILNFRALRTKSMASQQYTRAPGFKMVKERSTLMAQCSDAAWHHKLTVMLIGKPARPRAFKHVNMKSLPANYRNQNNIWLERSLCPMLLNLVKKINSPRVIFDNSPLHTDIEELVMKLQQHFYLQKLHPCYSLWIRIFCSHFN